MMSSIYNAGVNPNQEGGFLVPLISKLAGPMLGTMFGVPQRGGTVLPRSFRMKRQYGGARTAKNKKIKISNVGQLMDASFLQRPVVNYDNLAGPSNDMGLNPIAGGPTRTMMIRKPAGRRQKYAPKTDNNILAMRQRINKIGLARQKHGRRVPYQFLSKEALALPNDQLNAWMRSSQRDGADVLVNIDDDARPSTSRAVAVPSPSRAAARQRRRQVSTPPTPPAPTKGKILSLENKNLNIVLRALGLLTRKDGFEDKRHKFMGWYLHGKNAGEPRPGRRAHLARQGFIFAQLMFNSGKKDIPLSRYKRSRNRNKAEALSEAMGPIRRRGNGGQRGGMIGVAVPAAAITAAKVLMGVGGAGAALAGVIAPIAKILGAGAVTGAGTVLGSKLTDKL